MLKKNIVICPICAQGAKYIGNENYLVAKFKYLATRVYFCKSCNTYFRKKLLPEVLNAHFANIGYNLPLNTELYSKKRLAFFKEVKNICYNSLPINQTDIKNLRLLDVGCGFGTFLQLMKQEGWDVSGVEPTQQARLIVNERGFNIYKNIKEIAETETYHLIAFLDSFYYFQNPYKILDKVLNLLAPGGNLVLRVTNRNLFLSIYLFFSNIGIKKHAAYFTIPHSLFGDLSIAFSKKSFDFFLSHYNLKNIKYVPEKGYGKFLSLKKRIYYSLTYYITCLVGKRIIFSPGMFVIITKQ